MKKLLAALLALALLLSAAALGEAAETEATAEPETDPDDVKGLWYMREMTLEDGTTAIPGDMGMLFTIELLDDGAAVITDTRGAYQQVDKGVWRREESMVSIVVDDDFSILLRKEGDALTAEQAQTGSKWLFVREEPEPAYQPAEPMDAELVTLEAYTGSWKVARVQVAGLYYAPDMLGEESGAVIDGLMVKLYGGIPFGATDVEMEFSEGALVHAGLEVEPTPIVEITPEPTAVPPYETVNEDGEVVLITPEPTPEPTPTPTPEPTLEPRLRTSWYDLTARLLADDTLSLTVGLEGETLAVFILDRE